MPSPRLAFQKGHADQGELVPYWPGDEKLPARLLDKLHLWRPQFSALSEPRDLARQSMLKTLGHLVSRGTPKSVQELFGPAGEAVRAELVLAAWRQGLDTVDLGPEAWKTERIRAFAADALRAAKSKPLRSGRQPTGDADVRFLGELREYWNDVQKRLQAQLDNLRKKDAETAHIARYESAADFVRTMFERAGRRISDSRRRDFKAALDGAPWEPAAQ